MNDTTNSVTDAPQPIYCSQCGQQQGFGTGGYSHCADHQADSADAQAWAEFDKWCRGGGV